MKKEKDAFIQGLGYAIGWLVNSHDKPTLAAELIDESGFSLSAFKTNCDSYDFKFIKLAARNSKRNKKT